MTVADSPSGEGAKLDSESEELAEDGEPEDAAEFEGDEKPAEIHPQDPPPATPNTPDRIEVNSPF